MKAIYDTKEEALRTLGSDVKVAECDGCECWCELHLLESANEGWFCPECIDEAKAEEREGGKLPRMITLILESLQESDEFQEAHSDARFATYREVGMMTMNDGFVIRIGNEEYQFTAHHRTRY